MRLFLLSRFAIPLHLAFIAGYLACRVIGPDSLVAYLPIAWFAASLIEITLLFPSARRGEDARDARKRVRASLIKDPVCAIGIAGFLFILLQTLNGPRYIRFDALAHAWNLTPARIRDFPACVDRLASTQGLFWNLLLIPAMLAIRNGIGKNGRTLLLKYLVLIAALLALYGLVTYDPSLADTATRPFATLPNPIVAGIYFFMHFCVACGLYVTEIGEEIRDRWQVRLLLAACALTLAGAVYSLSCLTLALSAGAFVIILAYGAIYLSNRMAAGEKMRLMAAGLILAGLIAFLHIVAYPNNRIHERTAKVLSGAWTTEAERAERAVLDDVATRMFKANLFQGVGTWGYARPDCFGMYMADDDWERLANPDTTPATCGNDLRQGLAEYGLIGFSILFLPFLLPVFETLRRLALNFRPRRSSSKDSATSSENEAHPFTDRIPPLAFVLFLATIPPFVLSFRFSLFRHPLLLLTWTLFLTVLPTFIRKPAAT